jgi:hypothetical protein
MEHFSFGNALPLECHPKGAAVSRESRDLVFRLCTIPLAETKAGYAISREVEPLYCLRWSSVATNSPQEQNA